MPQQDVYGRWLSDDGSMVWDGRAWQPAAPPPGNPLAAPASALAPSSKGTVSLGLGIGSMFGWILPIVGVPLSISAIVVGWLSANTTSRARGRWGLILGVIGLVLSIANAILGAYIAVSRSS